MNNVIVLLVDSVYSECLGKGRTEESSTPFIDKMIQSGIFAPNVYSYGPYTDAASKGLYCGAPTLNDYGYYFGINSSDYNHFRLFKENGYETYGFYYPYYLISSKVEQYIDHSVYTSGFLYESVWNGKFEYYAQIKNKRSLTEQEYKILQKCLDMIFDCWLTFYTNLDIDKEADSIIKILDNKNNKKSGHLALLKQFKLYNNGKNIYIEKVLALGMQHPLAGINTFDFNKFVSTSYLSKYIYKKYKHFFRKLSKKNFMRNMANNHISISKAFKGFIKFLKTRKVDDLRYFANYIMCLFAPEILKRRSLKPRWQLGPSMNNQVMTALKQLDKRTDTSKPFYLSIHTEEPHNYVSFFSYDTQDEATIKEELKYIEPLVEGCGNLFAGNLTYQLALRYVDLCVKRLVDGLKPRGLLEKTTIMLMADHGSSYTHSPIRSCMVNNFYKENYKTPLLIWQKNMSIDKRNTYPGLYVAEDVYSTLCECIGINVPKQMCGCSLYKKPNGRNFIITEFMGPGCPDMINRDVWISVWNKKYIIAYKRCITKEFDGLNPCEVYDLSRDPLQLDNCKGKIILDQIPELGIMIDAAKKRFGEIQSETYSILRDLGDFNVTF